MIDDDTDLFSCPFCRLQTAVPAAVKEGWAREECDLCSESFSPLEVGRNCQKVAELELQLGGDLSRCVVLFSHSKCLFRTPFPRTSSQSRRLSRSYWEKKRALHHQLGRRGVEGAIECSVIVDHSKAGERRGESRQRSLSDVALTIFAHGPLHDDDGEEEDEEEEEAEEEDDDDDEEEAEEENVGVSGLVDDDEEEEEVGVPGLVDFN